MSRRTLITRRALLAGAAGAAGCGASLSNFPFDTGHTLSSHLGLELHFFSVCCVWMRWAGGSVLIDPFWTHVPLGQVVFGHVAEAPDALAGRESMFADTRAVLVGHTHYDHVMGLPLVDPLLPDDAVHLGSPTLGHTFAAAGLTHPVVDVSPHLATPDTPPRWWHHPSGALRVLPLQSAHPNQWLFFHLYRRRLAKDRQRPPRRVGHYQEGLTLAYLVDLLDGDRIQARVYVETSSCGHEASFPPAATLAEHPVDVAVVSMDIANQEQASGTSVLDVLNAPTVFFVHYEDFFSSLEAAPREIVKVDLPRTRAHFGAETQATYLISSWNQRYRL